MEINYYTWIGLIHKKRCVLNDAGKRKSYGGVRKDNQRKEK